MSKTGVWIVFVLIGAALLTMPAVAAPDEAPSLAPHPLALAYAGVLTENGNSVLTTTGSSGVQVSDDMRQELAAADRVRVIITLRLPEAARRGSEQARTAAITQAQDAAQTFLHGQGLSRSRRFTHLPVSGW